MSNRPSGQPSLYLYMIKKNKTEQKPVEVRLPANYLNRVKDFLVFPIDIDIRRKRESLRSALASQAGLESDIRQYEEYIVERKGRLKDIKLVAFKRRKDLPPEVSVTPEDAEALLTEVSKLPWLESLELFNTHYLLMKTRKGSLETAFEKRYVYFEDWDGDYNNEEYLDEPVTLAMPQYEILLNLSNLGNNNWSNTMNNLAIRIADEEDMSHFKTPSHTQEVHATWASSGSSTFGSWEYLCLGEWENDINTASLQGLIPFLTELVSYIQVSGDDGNAYRSKAEWALCLGKKEYNQFWREAKEDESEEELEATFKQEYRKRNQPENAKEAPLQGSLQSAVNAHNGMFLYEDGVTTRELANGLRGIIRDDAGDPDDF